MGYWIDVDNGEYGMIADPENLFGLPVNVDGGLSRRDCERLLARARENGSVLVVEAMEEVDSLIRSFEGLAMTFIYSPVPPTFCRNQGEVPARRAEPQAFGKTEGFCAALQEMAA